MNSNPNNFQFNFIELIKFLIKWRVKLVVITLLASVLAYSATYLLDKEYKSKAVFYPGTVNSISYALFYSLKERAQDALAYGNETNVEQYLQLAKSGQMREKITSDFNLMEHYKIKNDDPKRYSKLDSKLDKNIIINRTPFNSIEIIVYDTDPEMAAKIANAIMFNTDSLKKQSQRNTAQQAFNLIKQEYENKIAVIDSLSEMTKKLGSNGVYNVEEQAKGLAELIGKGTNNSFVEAERKNLGMHVGDFVSIDEQIRFEAEQLTELRKKYSQAQLDLDSKLSNIFVVDTAKPDFYKAYPLRLITAIVSALAAFVISVITIVVIERLQVIKATFKQ